MTILIVDDEEGIRSGLKKILSLKGHSILECADIQGAYTILRTVTPDCILLDLRLGQDSGLDLLDFALDKKIDSSIIVMTGHGDVRNAVLCMKKGAANYLTKPVDQDLLDSILSKEEELRSSRKETASLKVQLEDYRNRDAVEFVSSNPEIAGMMDVLDKVKDTDVPILITGETGSGKEVTALYVHRNSRRSEAPFVSVNCAALNDNLLESELFGHVKGAFTGADKNKPGRFEMAGAGTLFLDELGDMSLTMQAKLLRVLQEGVYEQVGGTKSCQSRCRIVAATNKNLKDLIAHNLFREDLYYRINLVEIKLPSLRERKEDIPRLVNLFIHKANENFGKSVKGISPELMTQMVSYGWPGNIRQLKNIISNAVILSEKDILDTMELFSAECDDSEELSLDIDLKTTLNGIISRYEPEILKLALEECSWNISKSAEKLGISRKTLYQKLKQYNISVS